MTPAWLLCYLASELYVDNKDTDYLVYFIPYERVVEPASQFGELLNMSGYTYRVREGVWSIWQ